MAYCLQMQEPPDLGKVCSSFEERPPLLNMEDRCSYVAPLNHLLLPRRSGPALPPGQSLRPPPNQLPVGQPDQCPAERDWQPELPVAASRSATLDGPPVLPRDEEHLPQCPHSHALSPAFTPQVPCWLDIPSQHLHPSQSLVLGLTVAEGT